MTNGSGAVTNVNTYDEYGAPAAANVGRFQYTGQIWLPEAGLYHYKARAYNPRLGRFMQTDPIGYGDGMNLYAYVGNDPVNKIDPWGLQAADHVIVTGERIPDPCPHVMFGGQCMPMPWAFAEQMRLQSIEMARGLVDGMNSMSSSGMIQCYDICLYIPGATQADADRYYAAMESGTLEGAKDAALFFGAGAGTGLAIKGARAAIAARGTTGVGGMPVNP